MSPSDRRDPAEKELYGYVKTEQPDGRGFVNLPKEPPRLLVDAHVHIQSSRVAPLPSAQNMVPFLGTVLKWRRSLMEGSAIFIGTVLDIVQMKPVAGALHNKPVNDAGERYESNRMARGVDLSRDTTHSVGLQLVQRLDYARKEFIGNPPYKRSDDLDCLAMIMPMDFEYAHVDGYFGMKVYNPFFRDEGQKQKWGTPGAKAHGYWYPIHGRWRKRGEDYEPVSDSIDTRPPEAGETKEQFEAREKQIEAEGITAPVLGHEVRTEDDQEKENITRQGSVRIQCLPHIVPAEEGDLYEPWFDQVMYTEQAALDGKLKLLPLYHYDPRRWQHNGGNTEPFSKVGASGLYLGFKIYTALGYRPNDIHRLPILEHFYAKCERDQIPIMNHCTPGGAITYDMKAYLYLRHPKDTPEDAEEQAAFQRVLRMQKNGRDDEPMQYHEEQPFEYFEKNFVSPDAWRKVLERHKNLRLCLAHFGGNTELSRKEWHKPLLEMLEDYPNLYVDISSSFTYDDFREYFRDNLMKSEKVRQKIMFGSDWYMCLVRLSSAMDLTEYYKPAKAFIEGIKPEYWTLFSEENPCKFYKLEDRIGRIARNLLVQRNKPSSQQSQRMKPDEPQSADSTRTQTPDKKEWKVGDPEDIATRSKRIQAAVARVRLEALKAGRSWS